MEKSEKLIITGIICAVLAMLANLVAGIGMLINLTNR